MTYGVIVDENGRVLSVGKYPKGLPQGVMLADELPEGDVAQYDYIDGRFVINPAHVDELETAEKARRDAENKPTLEQKVTDLETEIKKLKKLAGEEKA